MKGMIDETELARLEELAGESTPRPWKGDGHKDCGYGWVKMPGFNSTGTERSARLGQYLGADDDARYIAAACNAVPALVAEVRRLREELNVYIEEDQSRVLLVQRQMLDFLRANVEAWEWWDEVRTYDPWSEHPYCTACGNRSKRGKIFDCAVDEYEKIKRTAREAVHADRE